MSSSRGKKAAVPASKKLKGASSSAGPTAKIRHPFLQFPCGPYEELFQILQARHFIVGHCIDWPRISPPAQHPRIRYGLGLYTEEFTEENDLDALTRHIHFSPSKCWHTLDLGAASYNPSRSKVSALPPSMRYLQAILAHTITERRESTGVINTHNAYFLWCMLHGHVIDLAYSIVLEIQHQTD
ncbi:hypothetical protein PVK06_047912 [Gossypium arboreum]|uniref:Uncharacterized protein n=1 Tax=Gossypium arboreum TaxID=29729 RepID=A0ABR0MEI9_GOSAR|nr:hypothetical protein PVK06_047912 [Gossypium arboreum]